MEKWNRDNIQKKNIISATDYDSNYLFFLKNNNKKRTKKKNQKRTTKNNRKGTKKKNKKE